MQDLLDEYSKSMVGREQPDPKTRTDHLWPIWDPEKQRLIDKAFKTRVVIGTPVNNESLQDGSSNPFS